MVVETINERTGQAFNDESTQFINWTDEKLMDEAQACHQAVIVSECFSATDVMCLEGCTYELEQRGYVAKTTGLVFYKEDEE